jgi:hypothetical protein
MSTIRQGESVCIVRRAPHHGNGYQIVRKPDHRRGRRRIRLAIKSYQRGAA